MFQDAETFEFQEVYKMKELQTVMVVMAAQHYECISAT